MVPVLFFYAALANQIKELVARNDLAAAEQAIQASRKTSGATPEFAAALSWLARGELNAKQYDRADSYAIETRKLADQLLHTHKLDADPWLPTAVGAAIEVHAQVLGARGERGDAVDFLRQQEALFHATSIGERIQKNLNLLSLEGKPAPALEEADWIGAQPPSLASLRGHPVLLFFWAHWCVDCKAEAPILAEIRRLYGPKGLVVVAPTKYYGYVAEGKDASPAAEKPYIAEIWREYYAVLGGAPVPLSNANFLNYGASTTPTLVLIDAAGVVRMYHPGNLTESELAARIQAVLK